MNVIISLTRTAYLTILMCIAIIFMFSIEQDDNLGTLLIHIVIDKAIAIGAFFLFALLYKHWSKTDHYIAQYHKKMIFENIP